MRDAVFSASLMGHAKNNRLIVTALLLLVTALAYVNGLNNPFVPDDRYIIFKNFQYSEGWELGTLFRRSLFATDPSESAYFRPLTLLTFALNYPVAGQDPQGYRLVNLTLHILVVLLALLLLRRLTGDWIAAFAALLFALHPAHVQAVSYISSRSDPLYTALALLCLLFWHKGTRAGRGKPVYFGLALSAFFLGLLAKEFMVVLPALVMLMDLTEAKTTSGQNRIRKNLGWYFGFLLLLSLYLLIRLGAGFPFSMEAGIDLDWRSRPLLALRLFSLYLGIIFYPAHLSLFRTVPVPQSIFEWQVTLGAVSLIGLVLLACFFWSIRRAVSFGILWFLISIFPVLNLTLLNAPIMEHWLYLPLIGLAVALVGGLRSLAERAGEIRGAAIGLILLALLLSARTVTRNTEWSDLVKLFSQNVASYPTHFRAWLWLAEAAKAEGSWSEAAQAYKASLAINPNQNQAWVGLSEALSLAGREDEAEMTLTQAAAVPPGDPWLLYMLALQRLKLGRNHDVIEAVKKSLLLDPSPGAYHLLGSAYLRLSRDREAEEAFRKAVLMKPESPKLHAGIHLDIGKLYWSQTKQREAREEWQLALRFDPNSDEARALLRKVSSEPHSKRP